MTWLLKLAPWYYRWAAVLALAAALFGWGYVHGFLHEEHRFDVYQAEVDAIGKEASKRAAERASLQAKNLKETRDGWTSDVARIRAYYAARPRLVREPSGGCGMPAPAVSAERADGAAVEPAVARQDPELEQRCALDAARLNRWREWARKNALPVE